MVLFSRSVSLLLVPGRVSWKDMRRYRAKKQGHQCDMGIERASWWVHTYHHVADAFHCLLLVQQCIEMKVFDSFLFCSITRNKRVLMLSRMTRIRAWLVKKPHGKTSRLFRATKALNSICANEVKIAVCRFKGFAICQTTTTLRHSLEDC